MPITARTERRIWSLACDIEELQGRLNQSGNSEFSRAAKILEKAKTVLRESGGIVLDEINRQGR